MAFETYVIPVVAEGPLGASILGGVVWYATLTGCNEGPQ